MGIRLIPDGPDPNAVRPVHSMTVLERLRMKTEKSKMLAGELYDALDPELNLDNGSFDDNSHHRHGRRIQAHLELCQCGAQ